MNIKIDILFTPERKKGRVIVTEKGILQDKIYKDFSYD